MIRSAGGHRGRAVALAFAIGLVWLLATPALAASPTPARTGPAPGGAGDQVVLLGRVIVARGDSVGEVVVFSGRAAIAGVVRGDVVVVSGSITVSGQVSGSVIAIDGSVRLLAGAQVAGDVLARGSVTPATGARVDGRIRGGVAFTLSGPLRALGPFASWLSVAVSTLLLGLVFVLLAPRALDRSASAGRSAPWAVLGWGVAVTATTPALALISIVAVVGFPLGLAILLALVLVAFVGAVVAEHTIGRVIVGDSPRPLLAFGTGWGISAVVGLVPYVSGVAFVATAVFGLGEILVATWRVRNPRRAGRHRTGYVPQAPAGGGDAPGF